MKKLFFALLIGAACTRPPSNPLIGHTYALHFYSTDAADTGAIEAAQRMNALGIQVAMMNDSIMAWRGGGIFADKNYRFTGDSLYFLPADTFLVEKIEGGKLTLSIPGSVVVVEMERQK